MYAKLINNIPRRAPKKVVYDGKTIFNPPEDVLTALGYYPVTYTDMPTDAPEGQHYESSWYQGEEGILQTWSLVDDPEETTDTSTGITLADLEAAVERGLTT